MEQGLNKTQLKEVQDIVDTSINKSLVPVYKAIKDSEKRTDAKMKAYLKPLYDALNIDASLLK